MMSGNATQCEFIKENFFFLDSTALDKVESKLYGYVIDGDQVSMGNSASDSAGYSGKDGAFVYVNRQGNEITITQDFMGCYGIYVFQKEGYFAVSNSFQLMANKLKKLFPLTLNRDYANHLLVRTVSSVSMEGTLINEIRLLPKNTRIRIDVANSVMKIEEFDEHELSVPIDSKEGIELLDQWYDKWVNIIRNLKKKTNNIEVGLSGGKDSRITFCLFLTSDADLRELTIKSLKDGLHTHKEDLEIATDMSKQYDFPLNVNTISRNLSPYTLEESMDISAMTMLGFHKEMHFKDASYEKTLYKFTGSGGEALRGDWSMELPAFLERSRKIAEWYTTPDLSQSTEKIIKDSCKMIAKQINCPDETSFKVVAKLYEETYSRHHFGKATVESLSANIVTMMPLMDSLLYKLNTINEKNKDMELIFVLILDRYCKSLLDVRINGGRKYKKETIEYARYLNEKYPFQKRNREIARLEEQDNTNKTVSMTSRPIENIREKAEEYLWKSFSSRDCQQIFTRYFSKEIYSKAKLYANQFDYYPMRHVNAVLAITKAISDVTESQRLTQDSVFGYFGSFGQEEDAKRVRDVLYRGAMIRSFVKNLMTARIDIKNMKSSGNDLKIECSDSSCKISNPQWFGKDGKGYQIESLAQEIRIKVNCVHDGELILFLRGLDIRDDENVKIPVYIDYQYLAIDDEVIFDGLEEIWHDKPYEYKSAVKDGEEHVITVKWGPHGYTNMELLQLMDRILGNA
ncbi:hypothetical protein [Selenomonas sp. AB3002]|uniref:hypothetical protein n=1 Tax=Selenomonas sp. AB3002 TaxID=1392502 RepID=UPI000496B3CB